MRTILILMDSLNRRFLKAYHSHAKGITPNIDRFSEDCVRFDNHFIGSAPCMLKGEERESMGLVGKAFIADISNKAQKERGEDPMPHRR